MGLHRRRTAVGLRDYQHPRWRKRGWPVTWCDGVRRTEAAARALDMIRSRSACGRRLQRRYLRTTWNQSVSPDEREHWFDRHMSQAIKEMKDGYTKVRNIIEIRDARMPYSSHPYGDTVPRSGSIRNGAAAAAGRLRHCVASRIIVGG